MRGLPLEQSAERTPGLWLPRPPERDAQQLGADVGVFTADGNGNPTRLLQLAWFREYLRRGFRNLVQAAWPTSAREIHSSALPADCEVIRGQSALDIGKQALLLRRSETLAYVSLNSGQLFVDIGSNDESDARRLLHDLEASFPKLVPDEEQVSVTFWHGHDDQGWSSARVIEVPSWPMIESNYPPSVRTDLRRLVENRVPDRQGRLMLWHGPPGTGKTFALRALAWEWRDWCDVHYILDPEVFFGTQPGYLLEVVMEKKGGKDNKERLIVIEDGGEMLTPDAKTRVGQGLSRLLNLSDGLVGQGLRLRLLITTNEPLERLHAAVSRPGRAASVIEFKEFSLEEAREWLRTFGDPPDTEQLKSSAYTLAELYGLVHGGPNVQKRERIGFAP